MQSQPFRPAEVMAPSNAGDAEGISCPASRSSAWAAPARAARPQKKVPARKAATRNDRPRTLDITFDYSRMSKESVKRSLAVLAVLGSVVFSTPAVAQVPLVVGSVRDQRGVPIAGARVTAATPAGQRSTTTQADGTFALPAGGATAVTVTCRFCAAATAASVP